MDVLSDVLRAVRLTGAVFFDVEAAAPFAAESPSTEAIAGRVMAGAGHVIGFHAITEGSCWMEMIGTAETPIQASAGEIVVFPNGDRNIVASAPGMRGTLDKSLYYRPAERLLPFPIKLNADAGGETCRFVCGYLGCDSRPFNPLLQALPRVVRSPLSAASLDWLTRLLDVAVKQSVLRGAGSEAMLARLAELMFVEVIRIHIAGLPEDATGWFAGLRNPQIGAALNLMHARPTEAWTLEGLALHVGMSRSAFAERFAALVRIPPMQYLARWRLQLAARLMEEQGLGIAQAAAEAGYQSEAAFNRAFKRYVGVTPGAFRRDRRGPSIPGCS
jgi:AraC-like DNA-binding protein